MFIVFLLYYWTFVYSLNNDCVHVRVMKCSIRGHCMLCAWYLCWSVRDATTRVQYVVGLPALVINLGQQKNSIFVMDKVTSILLFISSFQTVFSYTSSHTPTHTHTCYNSTIVIICLMFMSVAMFMFHIKQWFTLHYERFKILFCLLFCNKLIILYYNIYCSENFFIVFSTAVNLKRWTTRD